MTKKSSKELSNYIMVQLQNPPISHILGQTESKFQEINYCIFFMIVKDEMLSCMEPEALKSRV